MSFHGRRVALLRLLCFLSRPLRGIPWPPRGLASPTLLPVAWPCFAYFCFLSCVAFRDRRMALLRLLCFLPSLRGLSWPQHGLTLPTLLAVLAASYRLASPIITLLPVLTPVWASVAAAWPNFAAAWTHLALFFACYLGPCVALCGPARPCFAYFASCHGPCVAFRGRRMALLCSRCFLSWPLRGLPWPPLGLTLLTLLPVLAPAWPFVSAAWPYFAHFALVLTPA